MSLYIDEDVPHRGVLIGLQEVTGNTRNGIYLRLWYETLIGIMNRKYRSSQSIICPMVSENRPASENR